MITRILSSILPLLLVLGTLDISSAAQSRTTPKKAAAPARTVAPAPVPVLKAQLKIVETKRVKVWSTAGGGGFSVSSAPEGREFILLKYELSASIADDLPSLRYAKLEASNGEMFFVTNTGTNHRSDTELEVEQIFSVPLGITPKAFHFAKLVDDPAGGQAPLWTSAARVDLSKLKFVAAKD